MAAPFEANRMARMHSRGRGQSGSRRPKVTAKPAWTVLDKAEVEQRIVKMHAEGVSAALIGLKLRDQYGVPNVRLVTGKAILQTLQEKGATPAMPEDLEALLKRSVNVQIHLKEHKSDNANRRALQLVEAKIRRLADFYKREGVLSEDWDYATKSAEMLAQ